MQKECVKGWALRELCTEYLSQVPNEFFVFLFGKDQHTYARIHRRLVKQELLRFSHYLDLTPKKVRKYAHNKILAQYYLEFKMGRLAVNANWHMMFFLDTVQEMKNYKWEQLKNRKQFPAISSR